MAWFITLCKAAIVLCVGGGIFSLVSLATTHWAVQESSVSMYEEHTGSKVDVDLEMTFGVFAMCYDTQRNGADARRRSSCSRVDYSLRNGHGTVIDSVKGFLISAIILCGLGGITIIGAVRINSHGTYNRKYILASWLIMVLAGSLSMVGVILFATEGVDELKHTLRAAASEFFLYSSESQSAMKTLLDPSLLELSWSFYFGTVGAALIMLSSLLLLLAFCLVPRNDQSGQGTTGGVVFTNSPYTKNA